MQGLEYSKYYSTFILVHAAYTSIVSMCVPMCSSFRITFRFVQTAAMRLSAAAAAAATEERLCPEAVGAGSLTTDGCDLPWLAVCLDICELSGRRICHCKVKQVIVVSNWGPCNEIWESPLHDTVPLFSYTCRCDYWIYWCNRLRYQDISGIRTYSWEWFMSFYVVWISETFWSTVSTDANDVT